jgi:succinate dehydrogenase / fumarate reductase cytochrome b subunit
MLKVSSLTEEYYTVDKNRPVNLDLMKFHFPPMAIVSIGHRISGILLFLGLPLLIYLLHKSLQSPDTYASTITLVRTGWMKFLLWVVTSATFFHLVAGIRHLLMDLGFGESVPAGRASAYLVFIISIILIILAGVWIW